MPSLLERLNDAVTPDFQVERELARGGMGIVFLARDSNLQRRVAIKVLLPEMATEMATARFLREARILAALSHSHIIPVHSVGEADGLHYYVMDYVEGDTLADRLHHGGALSKTETVKLGRDLLDALETVHEAGVVHRDIKPSNIFLLGRRAVLVDFGIARPPSDQTETLTGVGGVIGTPSYMPPEQAAAGQVTPQTDIYALGMVLYEALTTRRWESGSDPRKEDWTGVPWSLRSILGRALCYSPHDRWPNAQTFRRRLWRTRVYQYWLRAAALTAAGGVMVGAMDRVIPGLRGAPPSPTGKLTLQVQPFEFRGDSTLGRLGDSVAARLEAALSKISEFHVLPAGIETDLQPAVVLGGTVVVGDSVTLSVRSLGQTSLVVSEQYTATDWETAADSLARRTWRRLWSENSPFAEWLPMDASPSDPEAVDRWWKAERLFGEGRWDEAIREFRDVVRIDATCLLCFWRITEIQRWYFEPDPVVQQLLLDGADRFPPHYRRLIEARLGPDVGRLEALVEAADRWDDYFYAWYLLAEEQLGRGPLLGYERASAKRSLDRAVGLRRDFAPIWWDRAQLAIAEGDEGMARDALQSMPTPRDFSILIFKQLELAYAYRFDDGQGVKEKLDSLFSDSTILANPSVRAGPRRMPAYGTPEGAVKLGELYASYSVLRRSGLIAQMFGFFALGQMDSMQTRMQQLHDFPAEGFTPFTARLEAVNWIFDTPHATVDLNSVIQDLERFAAPGVVQADTAGLRWILQIMEQQPAAPDREWPYSDSPTGNPALDTIVAAARLARDGRVQEAIDLGNTVRGLEIAHLVPDPFFRTVLHLLMAEWYDSTGNRQKAVQELRWHEAVDEAELPTEEPLVQEIDWAFGTLARWKRAQLLERLGDTEGEICSSFGDVVRLWGRGDPEYASRADTARRRLQELGCLAAR